MPIVKQALFYLLDIANWLILIRCIFSFFPLRDNRFVELLYMVTDPILTPIQRGLARLNQNRPMMLDFSPIVAYLIIGFVQRLVLLL